MSVMLAAGVQHVIVGATKYTDPIAVEATWYAKATFWATIAAIVIATVAAIVAYRTLRYDTEQFQEFLRRPNLNIDKWEQYNPSDGKDRGVTIPFHIWNDGGRLTVNGLVELLVPNSAFTHPLDKGNSRLRDVDGTDYVVLSNPYKASLYPNAVPYQAPSPFNFGIKDEIKELTVLWRIYDDYGKYPKDEYGKWELQPK